MKELHQISQLQQARVLLNPIRIDILERLKTPMVVAQLAKNLDLTAQRVHNHIRELLQADLVEVVATQAKHHLIERTFQAVAKAFWLSPKITRKLRDNAHTEPEKASLHHLLRMSERLQEETALLLDRVAEVEVPSFGFTAEIHLRDAAERKQFATEYLRVMHTLLDKYQGAGATETQFTVMMVGYPSTHTACNPRDQ